jgi:hypothetical protein
MKILNLCMSDSAAGAFSLSHALNKLPGIKSISLRTSNSWTNYPTIAEVRNYGEEGCRRMVEESDIVIFHSAVRPFYSAFHLDTDKMKAKKKFLYFHGSECRNMGTAILKDAADCMHDDYQVLLSTPDLLARVPNGHWLPVARDFETLRKHYGMVTRDKHALAEWKGVIKKTVVAHAPTNQELKGSPIFYQTITELIETLSNVEFLSIRDVPWDTCMRMLAGVDMLYDQYLIGAYGMISVEAAIFGAAVFCKLSPEVSTMMQKESGLPQPFIQWIDQDELRTQSFMLAQEPKLQRKFGRMAHAYCQKMHDDLNVAKRFIKIVEGS